MGKIYLENDQLDTAGESVAFANLSESVNFTTQGDVSNSPTSPLS